MKFSCKWITDTKKTIEVLGVALLVVYLVPPISNFFDIELNGTFFLLLMTMTLILPFGILVAVITNNSIYKSIFATTWSKSIISIALIAYTATSNVWATTVINEIYGVSANNFAITQTFLTIMFFVVTVMKWLFNGLFITIIVGGSFFLWFIVSFSGSFKSTASKVIYSIVGLILISATYAMVNNVDHAVKIFAKRVAGWGDFYPENSCKEKLKYGLNGGVIFVSPGKVLVLKEKHGKDGKVEQYYPIYNCTLQVTKL